MAAKDYGPLRSAISIIGGVLYLVSSVAAVPLVWRLIVHLRAGQPDLALAWALGLAALILFLLAWFVIDRVCNVAIDSVEEMARMHRTTRAAADRQAQMLADLIERIDGLTHWTAMSEATRSLLVRRREIDVFAKQIESAIGEGDWPEASRLIEMYEEHFGDHEMAEQFRKQLGSAHEAADDRVIRGRITEVRRLMDEQNFPAAEMALTRLCNDFPDDKRLDDLRSTFVRAQRRYREGVEDTFRRLLADRKFEEAAPLIDEMRWLDSDALAAYREQWKDCLRQAQHEARDSFSAAVKDKQWAKAVEIGDVILARFPDTTLAAEVRKHIDALRQRANPAAAPEGQSEPGPAEQ
ncbi:MAG: hypothetical protein PHU85_04385 [Phycisphaerae bacterium]|nr:hypothetical protein [Phycisphaerae bacterium]